MKFLTVTILCAIVLIFGVLFWPKEEERPTYHPDFAGMVMNKTNWAASKKIKSLADCNQSGVVGDTRIDWSKLDTYGTTNLCLFLLFEGMANVSQVQDWLRGEGFKVTEVYEGVWGGATMRRFGYDSKDKISIIYASWKTREQPYKFATAGKMGSARSQGIGVTWFSDGKLATVSASSIFN